MENFTLAKHENYAEWYKTTRDLFDQASSTHSCYWIIDPCSSPELPAAIWELDPDVNALPLYMNTYLEDVAKAGPMLIPYSRQSKLTAWLFQQMEIRPLGYLIQVEKEKASDLFEHFQNLLECTSPKGTKSLFRFYDPRVMYAITTYSEPTEVENITSPLLCLHGWEYGRRASIYARGKSDSGLCPVYAARSVELLEHIWKEVKIHTMIGNLSEKFIVTYPGASFVDIYDELEQVFNYLSIMGISDQKSYELAGMITACSSKAAWDDQRVLEKFFGRPDNAPLSKTLGKKENRL